MLYHATFRKNLDGIKQFGLKSMTQKNWEDCEDGLVCLATDPFSAYSYCETVIDILDTELLSCEDIIVFGIKKEDLDLENFELIADPNIIFEDGQEIDTYAYTGTIPAERLYIIVSNDFEEQNKGKFVELSVVPNFE